MTAKSSVRLRMAVVRGALREGLAGLFTYVAMVTSLVCPNGLLGI